MLARVLSALVALPAMILLVELGGWAFFALVFIVGAIALWEVMNMTLPGDKPAQLAMTTLGVVWLLLAMSGRLSGAYGWPATAVLTLLVLLYFLFRTGDIATVGARASMALMGIFWAGGLLALTAALRYLEQGQAWLYLACMLAFGSDTGAYFAGRFLGRHKLYEKVSPKKTWEGAVGGVLLATAGAYGLRAALGLDIDPTHLAVLAPVGAALGQVGDLAESLLKRSVGVKDSGTIMPGHGGAFDRIDALIFVGPVLFGYALWSQVALHWPL